MVLFVNMLVSWIQQIWLTINVQIGVFRFNSINYSIHLGDLILVLLIVAIVISATIRSVKV